MNAPVIINPNFYQVSLDEVNVFITKTKGGLILIDTGPPGSKNAIFQAVRNIGFEPKDIKHIIVTHAHYDHSGSLADILKEVEATVYMHPADGELVQKGITHRFKSNKANRLLLALTSGSRLKFPHLNVTPVKNIAIVKHREWIPDRSGLQVIYAPGHCQGHIALFSPENDGIVITADCVENVNHLKLSPQYNNLHKSLATIKRISMMNFNVALFSHGRPILWDASNYFKSAFGFD